MNQDQSNCPAHKMLTFPFKLLIEWPQCIASYFLWAGPLAARIVVGYVFMLTGWGKLTHLPQVIQNFVSWGIPHSEILTPFVAGIECFGGALLIAGLFTRVAAGALVVVMVVAVISAKRADINSIETLFGFEEASYFVIFFWLAVTGAGKASLDYIISRRLIV